MAPASTPGCTGIRGRRSDADRRLPRLVTEENEVGSAPHTKLAEEIGDVELHGAFGDIQSTPDLFVGKVLQQSIEHLLLPPAQFARASHFEPPATGASR